MLSALGTFFVIAALISVGFSVATYLLALKLNSQLLLSNARRLTWATIIFVSAAFVVLEVALFSRDYSIRYVYEQTANSVGALFTFTSAWAGLEGSLLLWTLVLCSFSAYVMFTTKRKEKEINKNFAIAQCVINFFTFYFLLIIAVAANPFAQMSEKVSNGLGANPLLQDHVAMAIHPPMLYIGYVGFVVPFAYVIASLVLKDFSQMSTVRVRRTSMIAWTFLTAGIILGAWWSYEVLGWGGYWAWDPVENASLLPWLTATAFIHSTILQSKAQMLRGWNYMLVIATMALTILGTFLTRSGVVNSVHAFTQSEIGSWLLILFVIVVLTGAGLLIWRYEEVKSPKSIKGANKKATMFLLNNIVFCMFALIVLLGTTYPLIADAIRGEQVSVGTPYYELFSIPIGFSILLLMGVAPMVAFAETDVKINERLRVPAVFGLIGVAISVLVNQHILTALAVGMTTFVVVGSAMILYKTVKQSGRRVLLERPRKVGAMIVHIGIAFIGLSIVLSTHTWSQEATLTKDEPQQVGPYTLTYVQQTTTSSEDLIEQKVGIKMVRDGDVLGVYEPVVRTYPARNMSVGSPSVHTSLLRDSYLTVLSTPQGDEVVIKIAQNPMVLYIWVSGIVIVIGAVITLLPQRRKADLIAKEKVKAEAK